MIGPVSLIQKMTLLFETIYSCIPPFIQYSGVVALQNKEEIINEINSLNDKSRIIIQDNLNKIDGIKCYNIAGSIYAFVNIKDTGLTDIEFTHKVLHKADVAVLPGSYFGSQGKDYVRMCFSRDEEYIIQAIENIKKIIHKD